MRSSARNQFVGTVVALRTAPVDFEVTLQLDDNVQLIAVITRESAESLGIAMGQELYALVKIIVGHASDRPAIKTFSS